MKNMKRKTKTKKKIKQKKKKMMKKKMRAPVSGLAPPPQLFFLSFENPYGPAFSRAWTPFEEFLDPNPTPKVFLACQFKNPPGPAFSKTLYPLPLLKNSWIHP